MTQACAVRWCVSSPPRTMAVRTSVLRRIFAADVQPNAAFVITPIHLPGLSGFSLVGESLRLRNGRMSVIFTTAYDSAVMRAEAKKFENSAYLAKPFEAVALFDAIHGLTDDVSLNLR